MEVLAVISPGICEIWEAADSPHDAGAKAEGLNLERLLG